MKEKLHQAGYLKVFGERTTVRLMKSAGIINIFILVLLFINHYSGTAALAGGLLVLLFLFAMAVRNPFEAFFVMFGIKFTYDALWVVENFTIPFVGEIGLLHLFFFLILLITLLGPSIRKPAPKWTVVLAGVYLLWVLAATVFNGIGINPDSLIKQSSLLFGLLLGFKYVRKRDDFDKLVLLIFLSTIIPVVVSAYQVIMKGDSLPILHYTMDTVRGYRMAGLYYDSATTGMVNIISILCNVYLISMGIIRRRYTVFQLVMIALNVLVVLAGGTRSVIIVTFIGLMMVLSWHTKAALKLSPLILVVVLFSQPYIDRMVERTSYEIRGKVQVSEILVDEDYRQLFTGRVSIWQEIWKVFNRGSFFQILFGSGRLSNAHSSYFFLLLQIGGMGLSFYLAYNASLLLVLWSRSGFNIERFLAFTALLSFLLVGIAMTTVGYSSFQWVVYLLVGSTLGGIAGPVGGAGPVGAVAEERGRGTESPVDVDEKEPAHADDDEESKLLREAFEKSFER
jgi:hypothetical protein